MEGNIMKLTYLTKLVMGAGSVVLVASGCSIGAPDITGKPDFADQSGEPPGLGQQQSREDAPSKGDWEDSWNEDENEDENEDRQDVNASRDQRGSGHGNHRGPNGNTRQDSSTILTGLQVDAGQAAELAVDQYPDAEILELELERDQGTTVWEVKVAQDGQVKKVYIDAVQGNVVRTKADGRLDEKYRDHLGGKHISYQQALTTLEQEAGQGQVIELELDSDDGVVMWEGEILTPGHHKCGIKINAETGKVLKRKGCR